MLTLYRYSFCVTNVKISSEQDELLVGPALSNLMNLTFYQLGLLETSGVIKGCFATFKEREAEICAAHSIEN